MNQNNPHHLRRALRLPRTHRWVSDWLFSSPHTPFHPNITIPPHFFSHALTFDYRSKLRTPLREFDEDVSIISIPVATLDDILVGYCLCPHADRFTVPEEGPRDPFRPPWGARFAFDTKVGDMLYVMLDGTQRDIGLHLMHFVQAGITQISLVVPFDEYAFDKLPNTVLSTWFMMERRLDNVLPPLERLREQQYSAEHFLDWHGTAGGLIASEATTSSEGEASQSVNPFDYIDHVLDVTTSTDDLLWQLLDPTVPEDVQRSHVPLAGFIDSTSVYGGTTCLSVSTDCAVQACTSLDRSITLLFDLSVGRFASPLVQSDRFSLWTVLNNTTLPCQFVRSVANASQQRTGLLRQAFSSTYFFAVLSVAPDQRLLTDVATGADAEEQPVETAPLEIDLGQIALTEEILPVGNELSCSESRSSLNRNSAATETAAKDSQLDVGRPNIKKVLPAEPVAIAPANEPQPPLKQVGLERAESAEERRIRVALERKKRNRLSAARSNARRKKRVEAMEKEIAENKEKVKGLQKLEKLLMWEREQLKRITKDADVLR